MSPRQEALLFAAIAAPPLASAAVLIGGRWVGFLGVLTAAIGLWSGLHHQKPEARRRDPLTRVLQAALLASLTAFCALWLSIDILMSSPRVILAIEVAMIGWIYLGLGWSSGWLIEVLSGRRDPGST